MALTRLHCGLRLQRRRDVPGLLGVAAAAVGWRRKLRRGLERWRALRRRGGLLQSRGRECGWRLEAGWALLLEAGWALLLEAGRALLLEAGRALLLEAGRALRLEAGREGGRLGKCGDSGLRRALRGL